MINELYELSKTLETHGIALSVWHRKYKTLPKATSTSPCVRIFLTDDGTIAKLESLPNELAEKLRKYGDNQSSFPAFNICSLYRLIDSEQIKKLDMFIEGVNKADANEIRTWYVENNWIKDLPNKVLRSMKDRSQEILRILGKKWNSKNSIIVKLAELCIKVAPNFREELEKYIFENVQQGNDTDLLLKLLFHKGTAQSDHNKDRGTNISIIFDLQEWQSYGQPVTCDQTTAWLNEKLLENRGENSVTFLNTTDLDAFGTPFINPDEIMPSVKLKGFEVTLRSMFKEQDCQLRYGRAGDLSYPISLEHRSSVKTSMEWLADKNRQFITWDKIDKSEILFVYPSKLPDSLPRFTFLFGSSQTVSSAKTSARFEDIARNFTKTLRGLPTQQKPDTIRIFTIRKIDKARSKVTFTHNTTPEELIQAAEDWKRGSENLPDMDSFEEIRTLFPLQIADIVNSVWIQNGKGVDSKTPVVGMKYYQGIELFLGISSQATLRNYLHNTLENSVGLCIYVGDILHGYRNSLRCPQLVGQKRDNYIASKG